MYWYPPLKHIMDSPFLYIECACASSMAYVSFCSEGEGIILQVIPSSLSRRQDQNSNFSSPEWESIWLPGSASFSKISDEWAFSNYNQFLPSFLIIFFAYFYFLHASVYLFLSLYVFTLCLSLWGAVWLWQWKHRKSSMELWMGFSPWRMGTPSPPQTWRKGFSPHTAGLVKPMEASIATENVGTCSMAINRRMLFCQQQIFVGNSTELLLYMLDIQPQPPNQPRG